MSVKSYQKIITAMDIQLGNSSTHTDEIFAFVQVSISIDVAGNTVKLRVIVDPLNPLVLLVGDYIVKDAAGTMKHMKQAEFEAEYTVVK